jgi:uncharacterized protein
LRFHLPGVVAAPAEDVRAKATAIAAVPTAAIRIRPLMCGTIPSVPTGWGFPLHGEERGLDANLALLRKISCADTPIRSPKSDSQRAARPPQGVNGGCPVLLRAVPASHVVLLILGGLGAGIFNGVAGGGSLISFPILLGLGYPALTANITNTIGIWPGYLASAAGFRKEIGDQRTRLLRLAPVGLAGGIAGALLLLTTSVATFNDVVPWLVLGASALFAAQPLLRRALDRGSAHPRTRPVLLVAGVFVASVYGGYFGAAMGVMFLAVLGLALPVSLAHTSGLRAVLSMIVNGMAAIVFLIHGGLAWEAVGLLALGSLVGGFIGAKVALALPAPALRVVVVVIGVGTAIKLLA